MKLYVQLTFLLLLVASISIIGLTLINYNNSKNLISKEVLSEVEAIASAKSDQVSQFISLTTDHVELISAHTVVINAALENMEKNKKDQNQDEIKAVFENILSKRTEFKEIVLVNNLGRVVVRSSESKELDNDFSDADFFIDGRKKTFMSDVRKETTNGELFFAISSPVISKDNLVGVLIIFISGDSLSSIMQVQEELSDTDAYILNRYGTMITKSLSNNDLILKQVVRTNPYQACKKDEFYSGSYDDYQGNYVVGASEKISILDWCVIVERPEDKAMQSVKDLRLLGFYMLIFGSLIIMVISVFISKRFLKPVLQLDEAVKNMGSGDFSSQIENKSRSDEIGNLINGFNEMSRKIQNSRQKLVSSYKKLKGLDKMKDEFLNVTSHELKTPLSPIISYLEILQDEDYGKLTKKQKEMLQIIDRNSRHLRRLISDILDISKLESKKMKFSLQTGDINIIIKNSIKDVRPFATSKKIRINHKLSSLPNILVDKDRIYQVITNILNNAIKFTSENGKVTITSSTTGSKVTIDIKDNGIGINENELKKIFKKFYQTDSSMIRKYGGTGLGLAICKEIIQYHHGKFEVASVIGKGTIFKIILPVGETKK